MIRAMATKRGLARSLRMRESSRFTGTGVSVSSLCDGNDNARLPRPGLCDRDVVVIRRPNPARRALEQDRAEGQQVVSSHRASTELRGGGAALRSTCANQNEPAVET